MRNARGIISVIFCILLVLAGCSQGEESSSVEAAKPLTHERIVRIIEEKGVSEIGIYKSEAHGTVDKTLIKKLTSKYEFSTILEALKTAEEIPDMLNTSTPDYDFVIQLRNNESFAFHFWLHPTDESGMFTNVHNTGIGYTVSKTSTHALLEYVK